MKGWSQARGGERDPRRRRVPIALAFGIWLAQGCAAPQGGWDYSDLRVKEGVSAVVLDSRLSDSPPYFAPNGDGLVLFLCRWPTEDPIPVSLPPDATPAELRLLRMALGAWMNAGLGVRFSEVAPSAARLEIRFVPRIAGSPPVSANALADCYVESTLAAGGAVRAYLRWASIHLYRDNRDELGRDVPLDESQLFGAVLHELGHALGYAEHPAVGGSVMQRTTEGVEAIGARVRAGDDFEAPNLRALYALPSGTIVGHRTLAGPQRDALEDLDTATRHLGWTGPYTRVGGGRGRYFYRGPSGSAAALKVSPWKRGIDRPREIQFVPNTLAREILPRADSP